MGLPGAECFSVGTIPLYAFDCCQPIDFIVLCPLCLPGNIRFFRGGSLNVRVGRQIRTFQSGCRLLERLWRYLRFGTGNAFVLAGKALFFVVLRISRGEDKICSAGVLRSGILVGRVECFLYTRCYGEIFYNLPHTTLWAAKRSIGMFRLMFRDVMFGRKGAGGEKTFGNEVQKRIEGKGRRKERGVGKTEIRKTGGRGKGRKKGGRKKEAAGKKECGVTPKDGEKRKTVERGRRAGTAGRRRTGNETG